MLACRLFIDPPADGAWNMAVDEALLDEAADKGLASLRFYQWSRPTLSLGYFQHCANRNDHAASRSAAAVRRLSGGGALLHDRELTYSMCLPAQHPQSRQSARLYGLAHEALVEMLAQLGVQARLVGDSSLDSARASVAAVDAEAFLCFARRTPDDVVAPLPDGGLAKIAGSAQRRRRGAVLQHGAVLLDASPHAPELLGLQQCGAPKLTASELIKPWCDGLAARLGLCLNPANERSVGRLQLRQDLVAKYAGAAWTEWR